MQKVDARVLYDTLRMLRLHGFVLTYYGGKALHAGAGTPTSQETWRTALAGVAASVTRDGDMTPQQARELVSTIQANLFDLNLVQPSRAGATVAAAISDSTAKV